MEPKEYKTKSGKTYKFRELTFGEVCDVLDEATTIDKETLMSKISVKKSRFARLRRMIVEPKMTDAEFENLTEAEGNELYMASITLNAVPLVSSQKPSLDTEA